MVLSQTGSKSTTFATTHHAFDQIISEPLRIERTWRGRIREHSMRPRHIAHTDMSTRLRIPTEGKVGVTVELALVTDNASGIAFMGGPLGVDL